MSKFTHIRQIGMLILFFLSGLNILNKKAFFMSDVLAYAICIVSIGLIIYKVAMTTREWKKIPFIDEKESLRKLVVFASLVFMIGISTPLNLPAYFILAVVLMIRIYPVIQH